MVDFAITPSVIDGILTLPSSKSHTLRAILFGALAKGTSHIESYLDSPDTHAMINAVRLLGAKVIIQKDSLFIEGCSGKLQTPDDVIQCGNSGLVLRLIGALSALTPQYCILTGDISIRHKRPVKPLLEALSQLGCFAASSKGDDYAPLVIKGPFTKNFARLDGQDSQPVSGLLIAGAFAPHPIKLEVTNPGETPWVDLTLDWFKRLNIPYKMKDYTHYEMYGSGSIDAFTYKVPGDLSTLAFPVAAALLNQSKLTIHNVDLNDVQGDKIFLSILEKMGAKFSIDPLRKTLSVEKNHFLQGVKIDLNQCIDALPILSVIACFAKGSTEITNAAIARKKESDRISCITSELKKMGALIEEKEDGLIIHPSTLYGAHVKSYQDHRLALSLSVAAFVAKGSSCIQDVECIAKTYPEFYKDFSKIGAKIKTL
jgi:3-phosphoshikimate 1-carboxyvinyltransferase